MTGTSRFPREPEAVRRLAAVSPVPTLAKRYDDSFFWLATWDVIYHLSAVAFWFLFPFHRWEHLHHPLMAYVGMVPRLLSEERRTRHADAVVAELVAADRPFFLFPLQMENDAQIQAYSPYRDMARPIAEVVGSFARNAPADARLVVKLHPLDPGLRNFARRVDRAAERAGVAGRVVFLDGGSLDRLLGAASGVVTINSTVGLWALRQDCPVVTLGDAIYNLEGLVTIGALDDFWVERRPPDPALRDAFVRALAGTVQIRGVYHREPGLSAGVDAAVERLDAGCINRPPGASAPVAERLESLGPATAAGAV